MSLEVRVAGADQTDEVSARPSLDFERGTPPVRWPVDAQAGDASFDLLTAVAVDRGDDIEIVQGAPLSRVFRGAVVRSNAIEVQRTSRVRVRARDVLRLLAPGLTVAPLDNPLISECVTAVLEAAGIGAGDRRVRASTRRVAAFWLDTPDDPIRVLQNLTVTDGPHARLYLDGNGRVVFDPGSRRATQGRSTAVQERFDVVTARRSVLPSATEALLRYRPQAAAALRTSVPWRP